VGSFKRKLYEQMNIKALQTYGKRLRRPLTPRQRAPHSERGSKGSSIFFGFWPIYTRVYIQLTFI